MTEFAPETQSHMQPWREHRMERDSSATATQEHEPHNAHQPAPVHLSTYDHYQPSVLQESDQWSPTHHEDHAVSSPHSQASGGSMVHSPGSRQSSEQRPSVDISAGSAGEHMTLSERRQEKRKMKRFRLTHNQTRYLMSEFARQAHPDAAHRERLAREIPGLSPRQVQVWFQNRRAKLKRMSSHDRDSMMKSRALPEDFPIVQTLHHSYGRGIINSPMASPTEYPGSTGISYTHRPDPLRRRHLGDDEIAVSPTTPAYGPLSFGPSTPTTGDVMSPISTGERPAYMGGYMTAPLGPQQRENPFSRANNYRTHQSVPRLQLHENARGVGDTAGSPLATSTTYSSQIGQEEYQSSTGAYSLQSLSYNEPARSMPQESPHSPYVASNPGGFPHPYPSPAPANGNGNRTPFPPPLTLSEYKYPQPPLTPHSGTLSGFATAPLAPPQEYQIPQMSAPAETTAFGNSYLSRHASIGSATASPAPPKMDSDRPGRLSFSTDRGYGHKRQRSSSHPPSFTPSRDP